MSGNDASAPVNDCNLPELIPVRIIDHSHASDEFEIPRDAAISERSNHSQVPLFFPLPSFLCPITREVMRDPVIAEDGHSYERAAIQEWLSRRCARPTSPVTGAMLSSIDLFPNHALRSSIYELESIHVSQSGVSGDSEEKENNPEPAPMQPSTNSSNADVADFIRRIGEFSPQVVGSSRHPSPNLQNEFFLNLHKILNFGVEPMFARMDAEVLFRILSVTINCIPGKQMSRILWTKQLADDLLTGKWVISGGIKLGHFVSASSEIELMRQSDHGLLLEVLEDGMLRRVPTGRLAKEKPITSYEILIDALVNLHCLLRFIYPNAVQVHEVLARCLLEMRIYSRKTQAKPIEQVVKYFHGQLSKWIGRAVVTSSGITYGGLSHDPRQLPILDIDHLLAEMSNPFLDSEIGSISQVHRHLRRNMPMDEIKGVRFCYDFHIQGECNRRGNCNFSHNSIDECL